MADFSRSAQRFYYAGISLQPQDALGPGKHSWALNMRSYEEGTVTPRFGTALVATVGSGPLHSILRLNDAGAYATAGNEALWIIGSGTALYGAPVGNASYPALGVAISGNPLSGVVATPIQSPRPQLYIADAITNFKLSSDLAPSPMGIAPPAAAPTASLFAVNMTFLESVNGPNWVGYGGAATPGPITVIDRLVPGATVTQIVYDSGNTGMASIVLDDMTGLTPGATVDLGGETVIVQDVFPAMAANTIAAILYDVGATGPCSIQPVGSFSLGQIEDVLPDEIRRRYYNLDQSLAPRVTVTRTVDFPVNALVVLGGSETVRIDAVAIGPDGTLSFRCATSGTFAAGATITGLASFRAYCQTTIVPADAASAPAMQVTVTPPALVGGEALPFAAGFQTPITPGTRDFGTIGAPTIGEPRATSPDDYIRFSIRFQYFGVVTAVRLMLDVNPGSSPQTFLQNYFMYEWRANDLLTAVQSGTALPTSGMAEAQAGAVIQGQVDAAYTDNYGSQESPGALEGGTPPGSPSRLIQGSLGQTIRNIRTAAERARTDGVVTVGSSTTRQLALGDEQWITLFCRVGDLTRVGTDVQLTLSAITNAAIVVQFANADPADYPSGILVDASDCYLTGGYGPDVSVTLPPYVYRYRYRNTTTGVKSNPSPTMRAGLVPRRGRVLVQGSTSADADTLDWFRFGGGLARWTYVGSSTTGNFTDDMEDSQIDGGETLPLTNYQPWPTVDQAASGTAEIAGTSIRVTSGQFNTQWAPDTTIIINGRATALYQSPASATRAEVVDNIGSGSVEWSVPGGVLLHRPLPVLWGGNINGAWFNFACGDPSDPGLLHWTNGNDPDTTQPANTLVVTSASEPLMNGFFDDGVPYVFSTDRLLRIQPTFGDPISPFRTYETACTKGLWSRWAFCVLPTGGVLFLAKDGIFLSVRGGEAQPASGDDLQPLFPQEDSDFVDSVRNLQPIDFTRPALLKLTPIGAGVYFDYPTTNGSFATFYGEPLGDGNWRWTPDKYNAGISARAPGVGLQAIEHMLGDVNGGFRQMDGEQLTDNGDPIQWAIWTPWQRGDDGRATFQWGDAVVDMNPGNSFSGIQVTPVIDNGNVALPASILGINEGVRQTYIAEVNAGDGAWSRTFGLWIQGACQVCDIQRPVLYLWEPARIFKQTIIALRATDYEDLGYQGAKFVQGVVIRANTYGQNKLVMVQADGVSQLGGVPLTVNHNGDLTKAYPLAASGWTPFIAELVRLKGVDSLDWNLLDVRWVWEPAPELATQWETQFTTFDLPGFLDIPDSIVAYEATQQVTYTIEYQDGPASSYTLPLTGGLYRRLRQIHQAQKGKAVRFRWTSNSPFRLYKRDTTVHVQQWGVGNYREAQPFGGPSRIDGAAI